MDFFWRHQDADALFKRLVTAYGATRLDRVRILAERARIDSAGFWNDRLSAEDLWRATLEAGQAQGQLSRFIDLVLADGGVAAHHAEIRRLSAGLRGGGAGDATGPTLVEVPAPELAVEPARGTDGGADAATGPKTAFRPRVFISYCHESDEHKAWALGLSERLRRDGVLTSIDRYVQPSPAQGWPRWMLDELDAATHVLCLCTPTYYRRFRGHEEPGKGKGADWEGAIITQQVYDARSRTRKFIAVLRSKESEPYIPEPLRLHTHYVLNTEVGYQALYDALLDQAGVDPGEVGEPRRRERDKGGPLSFEYGPPSAPTEDAFRRRDAEEPGGMRPILDSKLLMEVIDLLEPMGRDSDSRQALMATAFFGQGILGRIALGGPAHTFATNTVATVWAYDDGQGARPALRLLLEAMRHQVGLEKQQRIDHLIRRIWPAT